MKEEEFGKIRNAILENKKASQYSEKKDMENDWGHYDSPLEDFAVDFVACLPKKYWKQKKSREYDIDATRKEYGEMFRSYIEDVLKNKEKKLFAVEFGGPGSKLFQGFSKDFFTKTIGVCLKDIRKKNQKTTDVTNNNDVIEGDILHSDNELYDKILKKTE